jgi:hypothetical protein
LVTVLLRIEAGEHPTLLLAGLFAINRPVLLLPSDSGLFENLLPIHLFQFHGHLWILQEKALGKQR